MTENKDKQATSDTTKERDKKAIGDQLEQDGDEEGAVGIHIAEPGDDEGAAALTVALPEPHERNGRTKRLSHLWEKLPLSINKKTSRSPSSSPSPTQRNHQPSQQPSHQQQPQQPQQAQQLHHYRESLLMPPSLRQMPRLGDDLWHCGRSREGSFQSEVIILDLLTGIPVHEPRDDDDHDDGYGRDEEAAENDYKSRAHLRDEYGTQRVYKKTSPNCVITLYLPSREIMLSGSGPSILRGIVFVDPKAIQGYRVYAQLTLTFRYGREDEEVMGLRFCNEAIMSLHQVWPRNEEPARESLSPLQEALVKRLGDGAHPFTLTLTSQAPPSVQLVPAKRYYGAPIGTSYDVRCFIADKTDEKFHRRASVKMGVRVIYHTDVFHQHDTNGPENFADLINSHGAGVGTPPPGGIQSASATTTPPVSASSPTDKSQQQSHPAQHRPDSSLALAAANEDSGAAGGGHDDGPSCSSGAASGSGGGKPRKSERGDSFPKLRLSPKSFRFSGRFGRSKSEIEKAPADPFAHYSKSFQEYDNVVSSCGSGGGPQGAVDKPFLLQDGRVSLRASLDKCWYTHGEDVTVTVHIRNDSRKTVRKVRVCAIQHVDVCMFNNGKFKNIVADSDATSPVDRTVPPGGSLTTTVVLRPQRGPTKNWIALEDTLQRSTEPEEITGAIAASAVRSPNFVLPPGGSNSCQSPAVCIPQHYSNISAGGASSSGGAGSCSSSANQENRNVFAIYVSYYVKVKLTLSGMGGELSLKLPFMLVHVDDQLHPPQETKLALTDVPPPKKAIAPRQKTTAGLQRVDTFDDEINIRVPATPSTSSGLTSRDSGKRRLLRSETVAKDLDEETEEQLESAEVGHLHLVEVHSAPMGVPPKARLDEEQHEMKEFSRPKAKESKEDDIFSDDEGANVADEDAEQEEKDPRPSNRTTNV